MVKRLIFYPLFLFIIALSFWLTKSRLSVLDIKFEDGIEVDASVGTLIKITEPETGSLSSVIENLIFSIWQKPAIYFGFDRSKQFPNASIAHQTEVQWVSAFQSLHRPIITNSQLKEQFEGYNLYTNDLLAYLSYKKDFPQMQLIENSNALIQYLFQKNESVGLVSPSLVTPRMRVLSVPFTITLWMSWKPCESSFLKMFGVNDALNEGIVAINKNSLRRGKTDTTTLIAVGDIMLGRKISKIIMRSHKKDSMTHYPFTKTAYVLSKADITIGNLECPISEKGAPQKGKDYTFEGHPFSLMGLKKAGFDILTLANNHSNDYGSTALLDTLAHLKKNKIEYVGAGKNRDEARQAKIFTLKDGTRIAFLGYTMVIPRRFDARSKKPGVVWANPVWIEEDIKRTRPLCDILVVQYHWGKEYQMTPTKKQREFAHKTIDLGADLVIGHHPHWIQGVEFYKHGFIAYSLGNFVFDMNHRPRVTEGLMLTCHFRDKKLYHIQLDPVSIKGGEPEIIPWDLASGSRSRTDILKELFLVSGLVRF